MTVALYLDHHVPKAIEDGLRRRGVDVRTAFEDGRSRADDATLLERATETGRLLFSQDDDLLAIASTWRTERRRFHGVAYAHPLRITIGQAVRDLELVASVLEPRDVWDEVIFLPL